jgi:hypothetical protein
MLILLVLAGLSAHLSNDLALQGGPIIGFLPATHSERWSCLQW